MREIKFRVWDKHQEKFICSWMDGLRFEMTTGQIYVNGTNFTDHYDIQQFTGLHDKNSVEIYEGDIVRYSFTGDLSHSGIVEVRYNHGCFNINTFLLWDYDYCSDGCEWIVEVIGNIHKNPELIED